MVSSVGSVGDSYDNALAETINGLHKAKVIWRQRSMTKRFGSGNADPVLGRTVQQSPALWTHRAYLARQGWS